MTLTSVMFTVTWLYAVRGGLVAESVTAEQIRSFTIRTVVTTMVFTLSIAAAMLSLWAALACWVVLIPLARSIVMRSSRSRAARPASGSAPG
jgi:hypothetical protein